MSTCSKLCIYLTYISSVTITLSQTLNNSTNPKVNCVAEFSHKEFWEKEDFPNPQINIDLCGRHCKKSWICDPNKVLSSQQADELDSIIETVAESGKCSCKNCTSTDGYNIAVALVPSIKASKTSLKDTAAMEFTQFIRVNWNFQKCDNDIVILLSKDDRKVYTEAGTTANKFLTDECIDEVHKNIESDLSDGKYYEILKDMTKQYKIILSIGNCDYISEKRKMTIAAFTVGAVFGTIVFTFSICALIRSRKQGLCQKQLDDEEIAEKEIRNSRPSYHSNNSYDGVTGEDSCNIDKDNNGGTKNNC
ncbi:unnamed protein product [Mytilus coruscus]|uniref:TPM domain-containing protein n=1 Tax=Mytilus coruscus TaxID=42192 RepID=A0A6J8AG71_MYTCO|nr:unnamed protein product [Mytilus coruscus]CAC5367559.1 unnamed protein product [Mytilus coruscus]